MTKTGVLLCAALAAAVGAGCGDGPICQSEVMVIIQSPSGPILDDSNVDAAGVQTDVVVRTTVGSGVEVTLEVRDDDGNALATATGTTDEDGDLLFEDVELPDGATRLHAAVDAGECGSDEDEVVLDIAIGRDCVLALRQTPLDIDFYAPVGVLNRSTDPQPDTPNFQADVDVTTQPGYDVELFVLAGDTGLETSAGTEVAGPDGAATFALSLAEGRQSLRAVCRAQSGAVSTPSVTATVFVDTEAPTCAVTSPVPGTTITPALDTSGDTSDGVQLILTGHVDGDDVAGEAATFVVTVDGVDTPIASSALDAGGNTAAAATIAPAAVPSTADVTLAATDHAANPCEVVTTYDVVYDGCSIVVEAPTGTITEDVDGDASNGVQIDVDLQVDPACAGRTVTSDCGLDDPSGVIAGDGSLLLRVDWCTTSPCDQEATCTFDVVSGDGIATSTAATLHYDDQAPTVGVQIAAPALACGASITPASDISPDPGVQIRLRVIAPVADDRALEQTSGSGIQTYDADVFANEVVVTLDDGVNAFVGIAADLVGNTARSATCNVTLSDIVVTYLPPAADGSVGAGDGTVAGGNLSFDLCGRVSTSGAQVDVTVDGGAPVAATVTGNDWCAPLTLAASPPSYAIVATATAGPLSGSANLVLTVDLSVPDAITDLALIADSRQSLEATWTAPADAGVPVASYLVKVSTTPLDAANFDVTGEQVFTGAPRTPGSPETLRIAPVRTGAAHWVGVVAIDSGGNRGPVAIAGPVTPAFDLLGPVLPPDLDGTALLGLASARGKFNDDELWDVAVGASGADGAVPGGGAVYVYFGTPSGIPATPDVIIEGEVEGGALGFAMTALRRPGASRDDLVISEPYVDNLSGRVYVYEGGAGFVPGIYGSDDAALTIGVNTIANYFTSGAIGWSLAALDFDGDGADDLAIGAAFAGNGNGGVAILYGGTFAGSTILLSDTDTTQLGGAVIELIDDPDPTQYDLFGNYAFDVGPTQGGTDATDDLLISAIDGANHVFLYRGRTSRPTTTGVHARAFSVGLDVRIDYATNDATNEFGSSAGSITDVNGDGAREIVISAHREGASGSLGRVLLIDGNTVGAGGVASTASAGVVVTTITPRPGTALLGAAIVNNAAMPGADVDGDGFEDLIVTHRVGTTSGIAETLVWFGGAIPTGTVTSATAQYAISGPSTFDGGVSPFGGAPQTAIWAGDVNGDGLSDILWADAVGNSQDGSMVLLWDE